MSLVGGFKSNVNSAQNFIRNPFNDKVTRPFDGPDFPDGFLIEEILSSGKKGESIILHGNMLPKDKIKYGGSQRIKKEFYSGYSEPSMQVFGPEETDVTITGKFKDKRYSNPDFKGVSLEVAQLIDSIRIRGNVVRIRIGEFNRYAIILRTDFDMKMITDIDYSITFSIIGFNAPKNAIFIQRNREFPFAINKSLIDQATVFQSNATNIPDTVPRSLGDQIKSLTSDVAGAIAVVTGFVDQVVATVEDVRGAVNRAKGLIKYAQNKVNAYKKLVGGFKPFDTNQALTGRYENAKFYSSSIRNSASVVALLQQLRKQLSGLVSELPLGRHLVRQDDTLQKISIKFYGNSDNWKKIYDYNNLTTTDLSNGTLLNIPRI